MAGQLTHPFAHHGRLRDLARPHALRFDAEQLQPRLPRGRARDVPHAQGAVIPFVRFLPPADRCLSSYDRCSAWVQLRTHRSAVGCSPVRWRRRPRVARTACECGRLTSERGASILTYVASGWRRIRNGRAPPTSSAGESRPVHWVAMTVAHADCTATIVWRS